MRNETDPRTLESYLERRAAYDGGLEPQVEQLLDSLEQWPRQAELQPRPGFLNELAGQLQEQAAPPARRLTDRLFDGLGRLLRTAAGAASLLVVLTLFGLWLVSLSGRADQPAVSPDSAAQPAAPFVQESPPEEAAEQIDGPGLRALLPLADYPPRDTPYLVEDGDFWLVHTPAGERFAFVPISPEYRDTVGIDECRYDWNQALGRFIDPCSGDEWELDGRLNLERSTELWSNRDLDRYDTTVEEGVLTVHLDRIIQGATRGE